MTWDLAAIYPHPVPSPEGEGTGGGVCADASYCFEVPIPPFNMALDVVRDGGLGGWVSGNNFGIWGVV